MADNSYWDKRQGYGYNMNGDPVAQGSTSSSGWDPAGLFTQNKSWAADPNAYAPNQQYYDTTNYINQGMAGARQNFDPNAANIAAARGQAGQGRGTYLDFLQQAQNRPLDSTALGQTMMRSGQQQVAGNIASQLASQQGRYNPAAFRQAQMGIAGAGQNMALQAQQQAMASAIQERAARESMLQKGYQGMSENDIRQMLAEQQLRAGDQSFWGQQQAAQRGWAQQGLGSSAMEQASRQAYEQAKERGFYGQPGSDPGGSQGLQLLGSLAAAAGSAIAASDVRAKQDIGGARPEAKEFVSSLASAPASQNNPMYSVNINPAIERSQGFVSGLEGSPVGAAIAAGPEEAAEGTHWWERLGAGLQGFGGSLGKSDERTKRNIAQAGVQAGSLLEALRREGPKGYEYKRGYGPEGQQFGPMANTLEKAGPIGHSMVGYDASGMRYLKGPETVKGLLAAVAEQQRQIDELKRGSAPKEVTWSTARANKARNPVLGGASIGDLAESVSYLFAKKPGFSRPPSDEEYYQGEQFGPGGAAWARGEYPPGMRVAPPPKPGVVALVEEDKAPLIVESDEPRWKVRRR